MRIFKFPSRSGAEWRILITNRLFNNVYAVNDEDASHHSVPGGRGGYTISHDNSLRFDGDKFDGTYIEHYFAMYETAEIMSTRYNNMQSSLFRYQNKTSLSLYVINPI